MIVFLYTQGHRDDEGDVDERQGDDTAVGQLIEKGLNERQKLRRPVSQALLDLLLLLSSSSSSSLASHCVCISYRGRSC